MKINLNVWGLIFGMIGSIILFFWSPPQPVLTPGVSMGLEDATPIDESGKTVAEYNREIQDRADFYSFMARVGMAFVFLAFASQLVALYVPEGKLNIKIGKSKRPPE